MAKVKTIEIYKSDYERLMEFSRKNDAAIEDIIDWLVEFLPDLQKDLDKVS